jgi:chromosome partitioning protein
MKILAITNNKGGVAKTTSVQSLGAAFEKLGKKVLLIDLDPQGNLSSSFGLNIDDLYLNIKTIL